MISDLIDLGSKSSYLLREDGNANLGGPLPGVGRTPPLPRNLVWRVSRIELLLASQQWGDALTRPDVLHQPLFEISLHKELFPSLYDNPFATRVHTIEGLDDFERGAFENCFVTEVNNIPTLVSRQPDACSWASAIYRLPNEVRLKAASWELAASKLAASNQFEYSLELWTWTDDQTDRPPDAQTSLAGNADVSQPRSKVLDTFVECQSFSLRFAATVRADAAFLESHRLDLSTSQLEDYSGPTIGTPLLRSIRLLEQRESSHAYYSLVELIHQAAFFQTLELSGTDAKHLLVGIDFSAALVNREGESEYLQFAVLSDRFTRVEVKLAITEQIRPYDHR